MMLFKVLRFCIVVMAFIFVIACETDKTIGDLPDGGSITPEDTGVKVDLLCSNKKNDCKTAPVPSCLDNATLRTYRAPGTCNKNGVCDFESSDTTCSYGCAQGACKSSGPCEIGTQQCAADGTHFLNCTQLSEEVTPSFGSPVPCQGEQQCSDGRCTHDKCIPSEVMLVLDRSYGMLDHWESVLDILKNRLALINSGSNELGFRPFPSDETSDACKIGYTLHPAPNNLQTIQDNFKTPSEDSDRPIAAALRGLRFSEPKDGQAIILITSGAEGCESPETALDAARASFKKGIPVHILALDPNRGTIFAESAFLDRLAEAGGTKRARFIKNSDELRVALDQVLVEIGVCACDASISLCIDQKVFACNESVGFGVYETPLRTCELACDESSVGCFSENPDKDWMKTFSRLPNNVGHSIDVYPSGSVVVAGVTTVSWNEPPDALLALFDRRGVRQWFRQLGDEKGDVATAVKIDSKGYIYVAGYTEGALGGPNLGGTDGFVARFDSDGNQLWMKQFGTAEADKFLGATLTRDDHLLVVGQTAGRMGTQHFGGDDIVVMSLDVAGRVDWVEQFGGKKDDRGHAIIQDFLGNILLGGEAKSAVLGPNDKETEMFAALLLVITNKKYNGGFKQGADQDAVIKAIAIDTANNVLVVGSYDFKYTSIFGGQGVRTGGFAVYSGPDLKQIWTRDINFGPSVYNYPGHTRIFGADFDNHGNPIITGETSGRFRFDASAEGDFIVMQLDIKNGENLNGVQFGQGDNPESARAMIIDRFGYVFVTGFAGSSGVAELFVAKYGFAR